jgi:SAM-dependent methyltransferase
MWGNLPQPTENLVMPTRIKRFFRGDLRIENGGSMTYLVSSFAHYGLRALIPGRLRRDATVVYNEYNHERYEYWRSELSFDDYVFGDSEHERWIVLDDMLVRGTFHAVRSRVLPRLAEAVTRYSRPGDLVIEFGAGTGRNLAYLARVLPDRRYLGLELTPRTVEDARVIMARFGLPIEMRVADITKPVTLDRPAAISYSYHAIEQLPDTTSRLALEQMAACTTSAVVCFEPIRELYPRSLRGLTARLRHGRADYCSGLIEHAKALQLNVSQCQRLGLSENPWNETSELVIELS